MLCIYKGTFHLSVAVIVYCHCEESNHCLLEIQIPRYWKCVSLERANLSDEVLFHEAIGHVILTTWAGNTGAMLIYIGLITIIITHYAKNSIKGDRFNLSLQFVKTKCCQNRTYMYIFNEQGIDVVQLHVVLGWY